MNERLLMQVRSGPGKGSGREVRLTKAWGVANLKPGLGVTVYDHSTWIVEVDGADEGWYIEPWLAFERYRDKCMEIFGVFLLPKGWEGALSKAMTPGEFAQVLKKVPSGMRDKGTMRIGAKSYRMGIGKNGRG